MARDAGRWSEALVDALHAALSADAADGAAASAVAAADGMPAASIARAFAAVDDAARARHRRLGIAADVTDGTLTDIERKIAAYGEAVSVDWLVGLARADVVALGRLQFERVAGADGRGIHVPEGGPLSLEAVDASLEQARALFGDGTLTCTSWLLDRRLQSLGESNIVRFARRFDVETAAPSRAASEAVAKFVFRLPLAAVVGGDHVRPRTSVERLVAEVLRAGEDWSEPRGVLRAAST